MTGPRELAAAYRDDAHHIRAAKRSRRTLCGQAAAGLNTLPADTTVWPDANAACWTCWRLRRDALATGALTQPRKRKGRR